MNTTHTTAILRTARTHRQRSKKSGAALRRGILGAGIAALLLFPASLAVAGSAAWNSAAGATDWNTNANWTPATGFPNGAADVATFNLSSSTALSISADTPVNSIVFSAAATNAFTITQTAPFVLTLSGTGITNSSGITQNFVNGAPVSSSGSHGGILFSNGATAGTLTNFTNNGATIITTNGGFVEFDNTSDAGSATFTNNGGSGGAGATGGSIVFLNGSKAASASITNNGATSAGTLGATTAFFGTADAGSATLIANGGTGGGTGGQIIFEVDSTGGTAQVKLAGNGALDISLHNAGSVAIGSLESVAGGAVSLGARQLTVGGNNLSTTFAGAIQDGGLGGGTGGSLTKTGTGTLTLTGSNSYTGTTVISGGALLVNGSLANTVSVAVNSGGTLGGTGFITNTVAINNGGTLSPGNSPGGLPTGSQTWAGGGNYNWQVHDATGFAQTEYDITLITGTLSLSTLTIATPFNINLWSLSSLAPDVNGNATNFNNTQNYSFTLASTSGGFVNPISGFSSSLFNVNVGTTNGTSGFSNALGGGTWSVSESGNNLLLNFTPVAAPQIFWLGGTDGSWTGNVNNWASNAGGTPTAAIPASTDDVIFSATGASNQSSTTLNQNFTIHSLTINDTTPVDIASGTGSNTLTISGNAGTGITVNPGAALTISAPVTLAGSSNTITVNGSGVAEISGAIGGVNGLIKAGTGTLTLDGVSTYTGTTTISAGALVVNGTLGLTPVSVNAGATLAGSGTFGGPVFINGGGTLSPGNSPGNVITDSQAWAAGGNYNWQVRDATGAAGSDYDTTTITGTLDLSGLTTGARFNVNLWSLENLSPDSNGNAANFDNSQNYSFTLASTSAGFVNPGGGFTSTLFTINVAAASGTSGFSNALGGGSWNVSESANNLLLNFAPLPVVPKYWLGGTDGKWTGNVNNWASTIGGTPTAAIPTSTDDVIFSATGAANQSATTLEQNFTIHTLTINDPTDVLISSGAGGPYTLTISGYAGTGIRVNTGATLTINANVTLAGASDTLTINGIATINGVLGGGLVIKEGAGPLSLDNSANTYSGGTQINNGKLFAFANGSLGTGGISFYGGELVVSGLTFSTGKNIEIFDGATGRISNTNAASPAVFSGTLTIDIGSTLAIGSAGNTGVITLSPAGGSGTATSNVNVDFGTLRNGNSIGFALFTSTAAATTVAAGATLDANSFSSAINNLQGAGTLTNIGAPAITYTITTGNFSGAINNGAGTVALVKDGADTDVLTLSGVSNYSGGTTINGGVLAIFNDNNLGIPTGTVTFTGVVPADGVLRTMAGITSGRTMTLTQNGIFDSNGFNSTWNGQITGPGGLIKTGARTLTLTNNTNNYTATGLGGGTLAVSADAQLGSGSLQFDGGTLEALATFSSAKTVFLAPFALNPGGAGTGSGTIQVDPTFTLTLSGPITATGSLTKTGAGTLVLTDANTYSGGTTLSVGSLFADVSPAGAGNHALGTGVLTVLNTGVTLGTHIPGEVIPNPIHVQASFSVAPPAGGDLFLNGAVTLSGTPTITSQNNGSGTHFGGAIGGIGGFTLADAVAAPGFNRFFFEGATPNTYTGLTTILNNADLHLAKSDGVTAIEGNLLINPGGVIVLDHNEQIANTSTVTVNSTGLAGANNPSGFQVGGHTETIGVLFGTGLIELDDKIGSAAGTLAVGSGAFSGVIADSNLGNGKFIKNTSGALMLTGASTYTSQTEVNGGTLFVDGSLASANVFVNGAGTLAGGGTLFGNVFNHGLLSPGHSPGTLTIGGNFTQFADGTLRIEVVSKDVFDRLIVGGQVTLGGTIAIVPQNGTMLAPGDKLVLVTAAGGVAGGSANGTAASNVTGLSSFSNSALLVPVVNLYTTSVVLELLQGSFAALSGTLSLTPNQLSVATALDTVAAKIGSKTGVFSELNFLDTQPLSTLASNLDKISPDELTSIFNIAVSLANVQSANILRRTDTIRSEGEGGGVSGSESGPGGGPHGPSGHRGKEITLADDERWGLWFAGSGEFTHIGSTTNAAGFNLESGGVTAGVDYRFTDHFAAGISLGYMNTTASLVNGGKVDVDGGRVGAYATWFDRGLHLDAAVNGGFNSYKTRRTTPNNTAATGSPDGSEINALFAAGYDWKFGGLTIGPTASYQYTSVRMDGFTETGAFAPLSINGKTAESSRTALGVKATYDTKVGRATLRHEVRAAWQHEFEDTAYSLTSRFATLGGSAFTVSGPAIGRDSLLVGAGFSVLFNERFSIYAFYDGELLRANYSSHNVSVGCRWKF